ncbi:serine/threonine-protein kinase [Streptomyces sp. NPDC029554]|uniref:serine/threonine-protein kinase n=1 Tax=Streptomyces sp. NPDC029554 TaxID=3155126 RepID=UPI003405254A
MSNDGGGTDAAQGRLVGGRYRLVERIGSGGSGIVWRAHDELGQCEVAVRQPRLPGSPEDEGHRRAAHRLHREARAAARVGHPAAVTILDVVVEAEQPDERLGPQGPDELDATEMLDGLPWIVMELVSGESLDETLRRGPVEPREAARIGLALLGALRAAHAVGIVHRDVKPSNVLIAEDGRVVLTDFGLTSTQGEESAPAGEEDADPPAFVAPERRSGRIAGPASDLWSLGVLLYTAVEGSPPPPRAVTPGDTPTALLAAGPPEPRRAGPLAALIGRLLAPEPELRSDAEEVAEELAAVAGPAVEETSVQGATGHAEPFPRSETPVRRTGRTAAPQELIPAAAAEATPLAAAGTTPLATPPETTPFETASLEATPSAAPTAPAPARPRRHTLLRPGPLALLGALLAGGVGAATQFADTSSADTGTVETAEHAADTTDTKRTADTEPSADTEPPPDTKPSADTTATADTTAAWTPHPEPDLAAVLHLPPHFRPLDRTGDGTGDRAGDGTDGPRTVLYGDDRGGTLQVSLRFWDRAPAAPMRQARKTAEAGGEAHYARTTVQGHASALADTTYRRGEQHRRALRVLVRTGDGRMYELRVDMAAGTSEEREGTALFRGARDRLGIVKG